MRYIILRDDDTSAFTPVDCLERLYRPFLARGLPVNLAVIPEARSDVCRPDGQREEFIRDRPGPARDTLPLAANPGLVSYLRGEPGYHFAQHGCHHDYFEFDRRDRAGIVRRIETGAQRFVEAGLQRPRAFVAPYDRLSRPGLLEVARRFDVVSTGWFEWRRVPCRWWLRYAWKKMLGQPHWRVGSSWLLSHPGCLLSYTRPREGMLEAVKRAVARQQLTVLVTHWWEYFRGGVPDERFIGILHQVAGYLADQPDILVISFDVLAGVRLPAGEIRTTPPAEPVAAAN